MKPVRAWVVIALLGILAAGGAARFRELGRPSLDVDEYLHVLPAHAWIETGKPTLPSGQIYKRALPYTAVVAASEKLFGLNETAARLPSAVAGLALIVAVFCIGRLWFSDAEGLAAAALVAVGPLPVMTSRLCRMYTFFELAVLLFAAVLWSNVLAPNLPLRRRIVGAVSSLAFLYIAHIFQKLAAVMVLGLAGYIIGLAVIRPRSPASVIALLGGTAAGVGWATGRVDFHDVWLHMNAVPKWAEKSRYQADFYWRLWASDMTVLLWLAVPLLAWLVWRYRWLGWYLVCMAGIPFAMHSLVFDWKFSRYVAHLFPLFALAVAPGIVAAGRLIAAWVMGSARRVRLPNLPARSLAAAVIAAASLVLVWPAPEKTLLQVQQTISPSWRQAYGYVARNEKPGDGIVTSIPLASVYYLGRQADYYLDNYAYIDYRYKMKQDTAGRWLDWYTGIPMVSNAQELKDAATARPHGWLLVDRDRFEADGATPPDIRAWLEANAKRHPKVTPDGSVFVYEWGVAP